MNTFVLLSTLYYDTAYKRTHNALLKKKLLSVIINNAWPLLSLKVHFYLTVSMHLSFLFCCISHLIPGKGNYYCDVFHTICISQLFTENGMKQFLLKISYSKALSVIT